jgi:hypothetical protein
MQLNYMIVLWVDWLNYCIVLADFPRKLSTAGSIRNAAFGSLIIE